MENEKLNNPPEDTSWLDELLKEPIPEAENTIEDPNSLPEAVAGAAESVSEEATQDTAWLDDLLVAPEVDIEIGPDEHAVASAGLSDISEMELEKIIQEAIAENWEKDDPYGDTASHEYPLSDPAFDDLFAELDMGVKEASEDSVHDASSENEDMEETPVDDYTSARKVRPRRKKGYGLLGLPHLASTLIWAAIVLAIGLSFGRLLWVCAADVLAFGCEDKKITITITENDDLDSIANKLYNAGLIKYPSLFKLYAQLADVIEKGKISVGTFELNTLYDYNALVKGMSATSSYRETTKVTIPEGYTCKQIFELLEEKGVCTVEQLETYASENDFSSYWFLEDVEKGTAYCLEGFLFPDTYEFYTNSSAKQVYIKLLGRFEDQFDDDLMGYLDTLNAKLGMNLTVQDVITVASIIQKESAHTGENYNISSVIYNRLTNANYLKLEMDSTLVYGLGTSDLTTEDFQTDHPYNTYTRTGLPPTPISNPGISSIYAALSPAETSYYFFALDPSTNEHHFSKTYKEHQNFLNSLK